MMSCKSFAFVAVVLALAGAAQATKYKTVADAVIANKDKGLGILLEVVLAADPAVLKTLSDKKLKATVFAPTDDAFAALLEAVNLSKEELLKEKDLLTTVLTYHVLNGAAVRSSQLKAKQYVQTLLAGKPGKLTITKSKHGVVKLFTTSGGKSRVVTPDIRAGRSVIHVIDRVLIPK